VLDEEGDLSRIVVDESSFDFRGIDDDLLSDLLDDLAEALEAIQESQSVSISPEWGAIECDDGLELCQFLYDATQRRVSPDIKRRLSLHLDKCQSWEATADVTGPLEIDTRPIDMAWSVNYAVRSGASGACMACIVLASSSRRGWLHVTSLADTVESDVYFFAAALELARFWRDLYQRDDIPEPRFFDLAAHAFPSVVMSSELTFRKFDGTYAEMRDWVVTALSVINDEFAAAMTAGAGQPNIVQSALGRFGLNLSPESPKTRGNHKVMRQRDVEHEGEIYRCEWHAKKEPHRNRIHFSLPAPRLDNNILIGIFIDHLAT
jgi:hypothetical protein